MGLAANTELIPVRDTWQEWSNWGLVLQPFTKANAGFTHLCSLLCILVYSYSEVLCKISMRACGVGAFLQGRSQHSHPTAHCISNHSR